jgi:hypothetical protein
MTDDYDRLVAAQRSLIDTGHLIEAGWIGLRITALPHDAGPVQISEMRTAFMCGAQYLFTAIMGMLEPGDDMTANDERRIQLIDDELAAFGREMELRAKAKGTAQ